MTANDIDALYDAGRTLFVSGIDTDAGKTYATAALALATSGAGLTTVTQKFIQTGCTGSSEDIDAHRRLTGSGPLPEDAQGLTAPYILTYPASAQLAAQIDGVDIDTERIASCSAELLQRYDRLIVEGAGGLFVPLTDTFFTIDYVAGHCLPVALVTNGRLGSINHTILSLEAIGRRDMKLAAVIYNTHFDSDGIIAADSRAFIGRYLAANFPEAQYLVLGEGLSLDRLR